MSNFKRALCITSGDTPAFERGMTDKGFTLIEEMSRPCESGPVVAYLYEHDDTRRMAVLLTIGENHYLFEQANIAPIFDSGDDEAVAHLSNPDPRAK